MVSGESGASDIFLQRPTGPPQSPAANRLLMWVSLLISNARPSVAEPFANSKALPVESARSPNVRPPPCDTRRPDPPHHTREPEPLRAGYRPHTNAASQSPSAASACPSKSLSLASEHTQAV